MSPDVVSAVRLSLVVALGAVLLALPFAGLLARTLARKAFRGKTLVEALALLPLVLPPVVTGFLLLLILGRQSFLGSVLHHAGLALVFNTPGMIVAGAVVAFPLMLRSLQASFEAVDPGLEEAARTLGYSPWGIFLKITLPLTRNGLLAGVVLGFARALGEFGATVMVSANTPGQRTLALEVFRLAGIPGQENAVLGLAAVSAVLSLVALAGAERLIRQGGPS